MAILTTQLEERRPVEGRISPAQGKNDVAARALEQLGGSLLDIRKDNILTGAEGELEDLREGVVRPDGVQEGIDVISKAAGERAHTTIKATEAELTSAKNAARTGAMSETMFKAKASRILKKYAEQAPGLTPEITQIAKRILGSDPTIDLLRMTFDNKSKVSPEQKRQDARYKDYSATMLEQGLKPKRQEEFTSIDEFESDYTQALVGVRQRKLLEKAIKEQGHNKTMQTANAKEAFPIVSADYQGQITDIWDSFDSSKPFAEEKTRIKRALEDLKVSVRNDVLPAFSLAEGLEVTYKGLFDRIDSEVAVASGEWDAKIASNRVTFNKNTQLHNLLDANGQIGYKLYSLMSELKVQSPVIEGLLVNIAKFNLGILKPENTSEQLRQLLPDVDFSGAPSTNKPKTKLGDLIPSLLNFFNSDEEKKTVKDRLEGTTLKPLLNDYGSKVDRFSDTGSDEDKELLGTSEEAIIDSAAHLDLETLTDQQFNQLDVVVNNDIKAANSFISQKNPTTGAKQFDISLENGDIKVKRLQPKSLGRVMFGGPSISCISKHLENTYSVFEKIYGQSKEDFVNIIQGGSISQPVVEPLEEPVDESPEFEETTPPTEEDRKNPLDAEASLIDKDVERLLRVEGATLPEVAEFLKLLKENKQNV